MCVSIESSCLQKTTKARTNLPLKKCKKMVGKERKEKNLCFLFIMCLPVSPLDSIQISSFSCHQICQQKMKSLDYHYEQ